MNSDRKDQKIIRNFNGRLWLIRQQIEKLKSWKEKWEDKINIKIVQSRDIKVEKLNEEKENNEKIDRRNFE